MTVYDLYMILANVHFATLVTAYDRHDNVLLDVENWGYLVEQYPKSRVLFFNYELHEIVLYKIKC